MVRFCNVFLCVFVHKSYFECMLIKVRKVNASVIVEIKESSLFQCICILFRVHINEVWITISRHLRSKRKSVPLGDAYSTPCRGNPAPTWCLFGANSAPLSAFPKKMHGTCIFFVMCWMSVSDRLRKMAKKLVTRILPSYFAPNAENTALLIYMKAFLQNKRPLHGTSSGR